MSKNVQKSTNKKKLNGYSGFGEAYTTNKCQGRKKAREK